MLQCVAVCCSVLQCVAKVMTCMEFFHVYIRAVCCSVLQCVAVCCSVLKCVAVCCKGNDTHGVSSYIHTHCVLQCVAGCCSVLKRY